MGKIRSLCRRGLIWVLLSMACGVVWSLRVDAPGNQWIDFRALYASIRCLLHGQNPYDPFAVDREYESESGRRPKAAPLVYQTITRNANLPTTYVMFAPLAVLPWGLAHVLWLCLTGGVLLLAISLMWHVGAGYSPPAATFLGCAIALNCEFYFGVGNTAGLVVGLCGIAVWCFVRRRFWWVGILCLAVSLAIKPHDAGLVWLYFVLAGGVYRKRALESAAITAVIGLASVLWFSHVTPHWIGDWNANLAVLSAPGGINDPGPNSVQVQAGILYSFVDLQGAISLFRDDPHFYNAVSYLFCGALLLVIWVWTIRTRFSVLKAWIALAAVTAFTMLITYHRLQDAKLVMLAIPACCLLWAKGGAVGKTAMLITAAAVLTTGEISLTIFEAIVNSFPFDVHGIATKAATVALTRPATFALLAMGVFYLWVYVRRASGLESILSAAGAGEEAVTLD